MNTKHALGIIVVATVLAQGVIVIESIRSGRAYRKTLISKDEAVENTDGKSRQ